MKEALAFDDVLLVPKYSDISSRSEVDTSVHFSKKGIDIKLAHPIVPANMASICEYEMAKALFQSNGLAFLHRFMSVPDQLDILLRLEKELGRNIWMHVGVSVGIKPADYEAVDYFANAGVEIICIDIAHAHHKSCIDMCKYIASKYPDVFLVAGNVGTAEGALALWEAGADAVKASIGGGSICTTRVETGNGMPTFSAVVDIAAARPKNKLLIADGGLRNAGDCCKALCYADLVMLGNVFSGSIETPGETITADDGHQYKRYDGSSTFKVNRVEGVKSLVPLKGKARDIIQRIVEGIQSCCSYQGARNLVELKKHPQFIRISPAGMVESGSHDVRVIK